MSMQTSLVDCVDASTASRQGRHNLVTVPNQKARHKALRHSMAYVDLLAITENNAGTA